MSATRWWPKLGEAYRQALQAARAGIAALVTGNLLEKHMRPLFLV